VNPLDLPGPEFLALYAAVAVLALGVTATLAHAVPLARPVDPSLVDRVARSPYLAAALARGERGVIETALSRLLDSGALALSGRSLVRAEPPGTDGFEARVWEAIATSDEPRRVVAECRYLATDHVDRVRALGLLTESWAARALAIATPTGLVLALGLAKLAVGVSRDKPVGFLVLALVATAVVGALVVGATRIQTGRGRWVLDQLREDLQSARLSGSSSPEMVDGHGLAMVVAVYGLSYGAPELADTFALVAAAPQLGRPYGATDVPGARRVLMRATRYHVYYVPEGEEDVVVLAVWSAVRGRGPRL
jgi:uncharacterized protein (TIGR04222 family)